MKSTICFLAFVMILCNSCDKKGGFHSFPKYQGSPGANMTPDSLRGREFVFDSLVWIDNDFGNPVFYMENMNEFMPGRQIGVSIKHDTSTVWELVTNVREAPAAWGYLYNVAIGLLAVWPNPAQPALIDKRVSLKVKFL